VATVAGLSRLTTALGLSAMSIPPTILMMQVATGVLLPVLAAVITFARHAADAIES
jgi:hypothetical protein